MKILLFVFALLNFMYIYPSDGKTVKRYLGNCPIKGYWTIGFNCDGRCKIKSAKANFKKGGKVGIVGRAGWGSKVFSRKKQICGRKCFCIGIKRNRNMVACRRIKRRRITSDDVHFDIRCNKLTKKVIFTAKLNVDDCGCSKKGAKNSNRCNRQGQCQCKKPYKGKKCTKCKDGYYSIGDGKCQSCGCNQKGVHNMTCNSNGECHCKHYYMGARCDEVKALDVKIGTMVIWNILIFNVTCDGPCDIKDIWATADTGKIDIMVSEFYFSVCQGGTNICSPGAWCAGLSGKPMMTEHCDMSNKTLTKDKISYLVACYEESKNVTFYHRTGNFLRFDQVFNYTLD